MRAGSPPCTRGRPHQPAAGAAAAPLSRCYLASRHSLAARAEPETAAQSEVMVRPALAALPGRARCSKTLLQATEAQFWPEKCAKQSENGVEEEGCRRGQRHEEQRITAQPNLPADQCAACLLHRHWQEGGGGCRLGLPGTAWGAGQPRAARAPQAHHVRPRLPPATTSSSALTAAARVTSGASEGSASAAKVSSAADAAVAGRSSSPPL